MVQQHVPAPPKARRPPAPPRGHGSQLRFGSTTTSGGNPPPPLVAAAATSGAALPTLNNRILQAHVAEVCAMQQAMLGEHLLTPQHIAPACASSHAKQQVC